MIDFRYHLVSIVAVFLALAIGLLLGSTNKVQEASDKLLQSQVDGFRTTNQELRAQVTDQGEQLAGLEQYGTATGGQIVGSRLTGQSVVFVMAPGASEKTRTALDGWVKAAGGSVTGWVNLTGKYVDDNSVTLIDTLAASVKPAAVTFAEGANAHAKAAAVLADVLVTKDAAKAGREEVSTPGVFSAFREAGLLTTGGRPGVRATLAIMVAPAEVTSDSRVAAGDNNALIALAGALDAGARGTVAVGDTASAAAPGFLDALRGSGVGGTVSSVDSVAASSGQVVTILALDDEMDGKSGKYGTGDGVNGYLPVPVPAVAAMGARP